MIINRELSHYLGAVIYSNDICLILLYGQIAPYSASKWAIEGLSKSLAKELPDGMTVVTLDPGAINTDMLVSVAGSLASNYLPPERWYEYHQIIYSKLEFLYKYILSYELIHSFFIVIRAIKAATMILDLTPSDNGASLTVKDPTELSNP